MLQRFRDGLIYPEYIINFRKDSIFRVLFVLLIYASIMSLATIVDVASSDGLNIFQQEELTESLSETNIPCEIVNSELICDEVVDSKLVQYFEIASVYIVSDLEDIDDYADTAVTIMFTEDKIILHSVGSPFEFNISDLPSEFHNMSFKDIEDNKEAFLTQFFSGIDSYMLANKATWGTVIITVFILFNFLMALFISSLTGVFIRNRYKMIPYKETFRFGVYVSGSTFILLGLMSMLGYSILFILLIVLINSRQMRRLVFSINSVLKNNLPQK